MEIVVASRNRKKLLEIQELLAQFPVTVRSVAEFPSVSETVEDGQTFAENALKKATEVAMATSCWVIGEDSGLCVDALDGRPGIYSARYAGEPSDDSANNAKLQMELQGIPDAKRTAHYICSVAVSDPEGHLILTAEAYCRGRITSAPRGENGFGYDPFFEIMEYRQTFGELPAVVKRHLSHRARAFAQLATQLNRTLTTQ